MKQVSKLILIIFLSLPFFTTYAQNEKDESGNPKLTQEFIDELLARSFDYVKNPDKLELKSIKNKIIVIDFWQTWCKPCVSGFKGLDKAKSEWPDKIEVIALSPDWRDKEGAIIKFMEKKGYDFEFVWAQELSDEIGLKTIPYKIIISPNGELINSKTGSTGPKAEYRYLKKLVSKYFG